MGRLQSLDDLFVSERVVMRTFRLILEPILAIQRRKQELT